MPNLCFERVRPQPEQFGRAGEVHWHWRSHAEDGDCSVHFVKSPAPDVVCDYAPSHLRGKDDLRMARMWNVTQGCNLWVWVWSE